MSREAMKLALEALEAATRYGAGGFEDAKDTLRVALAEQPAQQEYERGFIDGMQEQMKRSVDKAVNAMTQRTWVGLTDEERQACINYRAVEAKLKEKNT